MNIIKFVSVALWSMCMLFLSCKKENPSLNETPATVEIFVCNSKGEPLECRKRSIPTHSERLIHPQLLLNRP